MEKKVIWTLVHMQEMQVQVQPATYYNHMIYETWFK